MYIFHRSIIKNLSTRDRSDFTYDNYMSYSYNECWRTEFQVVVANISTQKADTSLKGTTTNIIQVFFLAYNIDVAASHRFITVDWSSFLQNHSTLKNGK